MAGDSESWLIIFFDLFGFMQIVVKSREMQHALSALLTCERGASDLAEMEMKKAISIQSSKGKEGCEPISCAE